MVAVQGDAVHDPGRGARHQGAGARPKLDDVGEALHLLDVHTQQPGPHPLPPRGPALPRAAHPAVGPEPGTLSVAYDDGNYEQGLATTRAGQTRQGGPLSQVRVCARGGVVTGFCAGPAGKQGAPGGSVADESNADPIAGR